MANEQFSNSLLVEVEGSPLPADVATLLNVAYVDDSRNLPDLFVLRFRDPARIVLTKAKIQIGSKINLKVQAGDAGAPLLLLAGEVTAMEVEIDSHGSVTEVRGMDLSHRLFRGRTVAAYANMTAAEVVRKVAQRAGLTPGSIDIPEGGRGGQDHQISQENLTDWEFLTRLADITGAEVSMNEGKLDFVVPKPPDAAPDAGARARQNPLVLEAGTNLSALRAGLTAAEQVASVEVRGWDFEAKQAVTATAPAKAANVEAGTTPAALAGKFGNHTFLGSDVPYRSHADADAAAKSLAGQIAGGFAEIEGVAKGNVKLRAGAQVALSNVGQPFEGKYTLTSTRHLFSQDAGYTTAFTVSGRQERSLYGLTAGRTGAGGSRFSVNGLAPAVVTDIRDPKNMGRVKLKFPWLADDYQTDWARTAQISAGNNYGAVMLPEVGDEVLVGFEQGDFDAPYVLAGLYNGQDKPPKPGFDMVDGGAGKVNGRVFFSRTGHKLVFAETPSGDDGITLATGDGKYKLILDKKGTKVTVHSDGTVLVEGKQGVTVDAGTGPLELKGQSVKVTSQSTLDVQGQSVSVNGQGTAEFKSSGVVTVQGSLVKIN
ncbi:MAG: VgrG-related protein [Mycobacteriales bacterium]